MIPPYDLVSEEWIPVAPLKTGETKPYSIRDVLMQAHTLGAIYDPSPLVNVALLRMLLAILHRVYPVAGHAEWYALWKEEKFPAGLLEKHLTSWQKEGRFDLFSETYPFYQAAGLTLDAPDALNRLASEMSVGNNSTLFSHCQDEVMTDFTPAEAARMIIAAQSFSFAGLLRRTAQIGEEEPFYWGSAFNSILLPGVTMWLSGQNLFETLMLNLAPQSKKNDIAAWERDEPEEWRDQFISGKKLSQTAKGPADRFTWQSRLLRLLPEKYGERTVVRKVYYTQGRSPDMSPNALDPMQAYRQREKKDGWSPVRLQRAKAAWRDSHALLGISSDAKQTPLAFANVADLIEHGEIEPTYRYQLNVVGMASDQAKIFSWRHDRMMIPAVLLQDANQVEMLGGLIEAGERTAEQLRDAMKSVCTLYLAPNFKDADGKINPNGRKPDPKDVARLMDELEPRRAYWARMEAHFHSLLNELVTETDGAKERWHKATKSEAIRAFSEAISSLGNDIAAITAAARGETRFLSSEAKGGDSVIKLNDEQHKFMAYLHERHEAAETPGGNRTGTNARAELASMRYALRDHLNEKYDLTRTAKYFGAYWREEKTRRDKNANEWLTIIGGLFGLAHKEIGQADRKNLGGALRDLRNKGKTSDSTEARFSAMLGSSSENLPHHLRQIVSLLQTGNISLDWKLLLSDVLQWDAPGRPIQKRWARDYYRSADTNTASAGIEDKPNDDNENNDSNQGDPE